MTTQEIERPAAHEYDPYYSAYIEHVQGKQVLQTLQLQLEEMEELLAGLTDDQALYRYAEGKWSLKEVVGHLMDCERVFAYRALSIARGEEQSLPGFEQDAYVTAAGFDQRSLDSLRTEYRSIRHATLTLFDSLDEAAWLRSGIANQVSVSVRALAYIIAGHEAHHFAVVRERYLTAL